MRRVTDELLPLLGGSTIAAFGHPCFAPSESEPRFDRRLSAIIFVTQTELSLSIQARAVPENVSRRSTAAMARPNRTDQACLIRTATPIPTAGYKRAA